MYVYVCLYVCVYVCMDRWVDICTLITNRKARTTCPSDLLQMAFCNSFRDMLFFTCAFILCLTLSLTNEVVPVK